MFFVKINEFYINHWLTYSKHKRKTIQIPHNSNDNGEISKIQRKIKEL